MLRAIATITAALAGVSTSWATSPPVQRAANPAAKPAVKSAPRPVVKRPIVRDPKCEKRIRDTGMVVLPSDTETICNNRLSADVQSCILEILTKKKGYLRGNDLLEVYALCRTDSSRFLRDCLIKGMDKKWNDPAYKSARAVGSKCILARRDSSPTKSTTKAKGARR